MKNKKMLAQAITFGLLLAAPCGAMAAVESGSIYQSTSITDSINITGDRLLTYTDETKATFGIVALNQEAMISLTGDEINITTNTGNYDGTRAVLSQGGKITLGNDNSVININASGKNASGIMSLTEKSAININARELNVNVTGDGSFGIHVQNNFEYETASPNAASLTINADKITVNSTDLGISAFSNGQMTINGDLTVNAEHAIDVRGNSTVNINTDGNNHTTVLNGDIVFETPNSLGDAQNSGKIINANVNVNLNGEGSSWTGRAYQEYKVNGSYEEIVELDADPYHGNVTGFKMNISNGAQWNMTDDSFINNVTVADGGVINVQEDVETFNASGIELNDGVVNLQGENQNVNVNKVTGNGGTIATSSLDNKVTVKEDTDTSLTVKGVGALNADAVAQDSSIAEKLAKTVQKKDSDESLADEVQAEAGVINGEYSAKVGADGKVSSGTFAVNTDNQAISNMASIGLMTWRAENNDMNKRLGELRNSTGEHGVWARMVRGESKYGEQNVKNQYNTYQLGYDEKLSTDDHWTVGAAVSYTDGKSSFTNGNGENKHTGLSLYGSYLGDDGSFVDLIAKYARLKHDFEVNGGVGNGDYDTNGYSVSAEYGKRFTKDNGFWLEPQVELTYGKVGSVNYMTDNGASVRQDGMDSLVGRVGFAAGKNINKGNVYLRASYLYDFDGETSVTMTKGASTSFEQDLGGGWWEVGVGTNLSLSNASHLYFDVEKTYGGNVATPWQWNAGVRWSF